MRISDWSSDVCSSDLAVVFVVLAIIDIPVIKDLAVTASIGVAVLVFTNLLLLPVLLSYFGVSASAAQRSLRDQQRQAGHRGVGRLWDVLAHFTERRWASVAIRSEKHTSELQSLMRISYAVFCLKKKKTKTDL